jgi:hypothetical protein
MGALLASSALALPEVGHCVAKPGTGKYQDSNCTKKATGKLPKEYEWVKLTGSPVPFTSKGGEGKLETAGGTLIVCKKQSATGDFFPKGTSTKEVKSVVAVFTSCEAPVNKAVCGTTGAAAGEIVTNPLKGPLGYISGEKTTSPVVGQELTPEKAKGVFVTFKCGASITVSVGIAPKGGLGDDAIICTLGSVNEMSTLTGETYAASGGTQVPHKFQKATAKEMHLESQNNGVGSWEYATQTLVTSVETTSPIEIKA